MSQEIIRQPNGKYGSTSYPIHPSFQYFIVWINCLSTAFATLNDKGKKTFGSFQMGLSLLEVFIYESLFLVHFEG